MCSASRNAAVVGRGLPPSPRLRRTPPLRRRNPFRRGRETPPYIERFCGFTRAAGLLSFALTALTFGPRSAARAAEPAPVPHVLHVTADPNNLPFSNDRGEGFENKIVALIARDLGSELDYTWWAQRRGWVRQTLKVQNCDLVPGVPKTFERTLNTRPYYRSGYVLVTRSARHLDVRSLDDPALRHLTIGVQMIGDDASNSPPAHALSARGIVNNVRGFTVYGDYAQPNPPTQIVEAVRRGDIDVACVWGPLAGYVAREHPGELTLVPLPAVDEVTGLAFTFDMSIGVRRGEPALRDAIDAILVRRKPEIDAILAAYGVPTLRDHLTASLP
jgi:mxaJ protein